MTDTAGDLKKMQIKKRVQFPQKIRQQRRDNEQQHCYIPDRNREQTIYSNINIY